MTESGKYPIQGACQCGGVSYQVKSPPVYVSICHCTQCQKLSGSAFSPSLVLAAAEFEVEGELKEWERSSDSGNRNIAYFCPSCGNRIYHFNPEQPEFIRLKGGTLSDTSIIQPNAHYWVSQKQGWVSIPDDEEQHQTQPGL